MTDQGADLSFESLKPGGPAGEKLPRKDRLDSWKEIAKHLGREVRTVQLWEKLEGLPVHRHFHRSLSSVFAFRSELDAWCQRVSRRSVYTSGNAHVDADAPDATKRAEDKVTVAVLPFRGVLGSCEQEPFNEGVVSEIIIAIGRLCPERIGVISRTAVMEYKESSRAIDEVGKELRASYLVEGMSQVENGSIRVNVSLVCVKNKTTVWSQSYKGSCKKSLDLQSKVANKIAHCLCLRVLSNGESVRTLLPAGHRASRDAYVLGRYLWKQRTEESLRKAIRCFEQAIGDDPRFALAHSGLADCFTLLAFYGIVSPAAAMPAAQGAALKAVELDPLSAEAHASLADIHFHFERSWFQAEKEYQAAIQCNPAYALSYHWYANLLAAKGQHEAAELAIKRAVDLDPAPITIVWAGVMAHIARRYEQAIGHYRRALEFEPNLAWTHMYLAQTLEQTDQLAEALLEYETTIRLSGGNNCAKAMKAHAHAVSGNRRAALRIVNDLHGIANGGISNGGILDAGILDAAPSNDKYVPSYDIAAVYAALGEHRQMYAWLQRAYAERNIKLFTFAQDPRFDAVRDRSEVRTLTEHPDFHRIYSSIKSLNP
jgi:TolB-like protein/Tfp pilus assembly protein PilF